MWVARGRRRGWRSWRGSCGVDGCGRGGESASGAGAAQGGTAKNANASTQARITTKRARLLHPRKIVARMCPQEGIGLLKVPMSTLIIAGAQGKNSTHSRATQQRRERAAQGRKKCERRRRYDNALYVSPRGAAEESRRAVIKCRRSPHWRRGARQTRDGHAQDEYTRGARKRRQPPPPKPSVVLNFVHEPDNQQCGRSRSDRPSAMFRHEAGGDHAKKKKKKKKKKTRGAKGSATAHAPAHALTRDSQERYRRSKGSWISTQWRLATRSTDLARAQSVAMRTSVVSAARRAPKSFLQTHNSCAHSSYAPITRCNFPPSPGLLHPS